MKKLIALLFASLLVLGACGQKEEKETNNNEIKHSDMSYEDQEKIYKKETQKLSKLIVEFGGYFTEGYDEGKNSNDSESSGEALAELDEEEMQKEIQKLYSKIDGYEDKTKNLNQVDKSIGDNASKTLKTILYLSERIYELENFKADNKGKETAYDIAFTDTMLTTSSVLESLSYEYEKLDADTKNEELGEKGNETITDLLAIQNDLDHMEISDSLGILVSEFDVSLSDEDNKILSNKQFRKKNNKILVTETPDTSKMEYNSLVKDINENSPEFLHYEHSDKMVSTTEYNNVMDIRNGIVAPDDSSYSEEEEQDTSSNEDATVTRDNVMDIVEEYEGESLDTDSYTFKEPEQRDDGSWGFAFYTKDDELAGSYIVDEDGIVTKFDEDGIEE